MCGRRTGCTGAAHRLALGPVGLHEATARMHELPQQRFESGDCRARTLIMPQASGLPCPADPSYRRSIAWWRASIGEALILKSLGHAVEAVGVIPGQRIPRSYWNAPEHVAAIDCARDRVLCRLETGLELPVSRTCRRHCALTSPRGTSGGSSKPPGKFRWNPTSVDDLELRQTGKICRYDGQIGVSAANGILPGSPESRVAGGCCPCPGWRG